ncbi:MAG: ribose-phosphate pyrophosphokinase, partial [Deltaproteobacteria bacterium]|nr:ribose-phosphate pyrophosphokinase [Deltaproteobacteria bacterium]
MSRAISLFSGNANLALAGAIAHQLQVPLGRVKAGRFSDGEIAVEIGENVRGSETYLIQSTCAPVNDSIMEMLIMADALRRSSADSITAIMPYYGYARQDRKVAGRTPISAKLVADLITTAGVDRVLTVDLHAGQIQGFFNIPVDNLYAMPVLLDEIRALKLEEPVMVSPDAGGVERARAYAKRMNSTLAIIDKRRERANVSEVMHIIGDVKDRDCVLLDDMIDTAGTLTNAARALADAGARRVYAAATHAVLSGPAVHRIVDSPLVEVIVTDSIPLRGEAQGNPKFRQASLAKL